MDIKLLAMDVDGVLTDGSIIIHADGSESKKFHVYDSAWIRIWHRQGLKTAVITGRGCPAVAHYTEDMEINFVYQKAFDKIPVFEQLVQESQIPPQQIAYIGDDVFDLPVIRRVGFSAVVPQAITELRAAADYITTRSSGCGAVGELIQHLLKKMDLWDDAMQRYRR